MRVITAKAQTPVNTGFCLCLGTFENKAFRASLSAGNVYKSLTHNELRIFLLFR